MNAGKKYERTFQAGAALNGRICMLVATCDDLIRQGYEDFSVLDTFAPGHPNPDDGKEWWSQPYRCQLLIGITIVGSGNLRCILSREGQVNIFGPGGNPDHSYQIPQAGVFGKGAVGLGYVNRIRPIDGALYVCGQSRQVYRFDWNGRDLAAGQWVDFAGPMRQPPMSEPPEDSNDAEAFDRWLDENDAIDFVDIAGPSESDIYAVGDEAWHWDGARWTQLAMPTDEPLAAIKVMSADLIYIVGHNGTLLAGNARDGFRDQSTVDDNQNFTGVEWFGDRLFLASNFGMFTFDPATRKIERYVTDLKPDLKDTHMLEAKDGILWSFGFKDLAWFDGSRWTRVDHPDNPPIR